MWLPEHIPQGGSEVLLKCPNPDCGKYGEFKVAYNTDKQQGRCLRCGFGLGAEGHVKHIYKTGADSPNRPQVLKSAQADPENLFIPAWENEAARKYLEGRLVSQDVCEACGCLYKDDRVWFPTTNLVPVPGGSPILASRSIIPGEKEWRFSRQNKRTHVFGAIPRGSTVILLEGVFDLLSPGLYGRGIATLGSSVSSELAVYLLSSFKNIFIWWDPDAKSKQIETVDRLTELSTYMRIDRAITHTPIVKGIDGPEPGSLTPIQARGYLP